MPYKHKQDKRAADKRWYRKNKTRRADYRKRNKRKFRQYTRVWRFKSYGITLAEYKKRLRLQNGVCAISGMKPNKTRILSVDHDHETGKVRGLLHNTINVALGLFRDNPEWLKKAVRYLESHK